jgi:copper chaperone CopZ
MQNTVLKIEHMDGEACADTVAQLLIKIGGVRDVRVSLLDSQASVEFDERETSAQLMTETLTEAGYPSAAELPAQRSSGCCGGCCGG